MTVRTPFVYSFESLRSLYVNMVGLWVTVSLAMFTGLTMFSIYKNCDPLTNGDIGTYDQVTAAVFTHHHHRHHHMDAILLVFSLILPIASCKPDAALPCDGYFGGLPWHPRLVRGCGIQWHP